MLDLQLGIRISLTRSNAEPSRRLLDRDLQEKVKSVFPREGSPITPPHPTSDFKWRDYSPLAFRELRESCGINAGEYMLSICSDKALRELSSPGKSGSVFYISHDDKFLIKTMRKAEMKLLQEFLPKYYKHMATYSDSLLPKFFGLHVVKPRHGRKVRFLVMKNLFGDLPINYKYDLKGATYGRDTPLQKRKESSTLKDLDLQSSFVLEPKQRERVMRQMRIDCALLESLHVMDYSILLGIHYCEPDEAYNKSLSSLSPSSPSPSTLSLSLSQSKQNYTTTATTTNSEGDSEGEKRNKTNSNNYNYNNNYDELTIKLAQRDNKINTKTKTKNNSEGESDYNNDSNNNKSHYTTTSNKSSSRSDGDNHNNNSNNNINNNESEIGYSMKAKAVTKQLMEMNNLARQVRTRERAMSEGENDSEGDE